MKRLIIINILLLILLNILPEVKEVEAKEDVNVRKCSQVNASEQIASRNLEKPRQEIKIEEPVPTEISQRGIDFIKQYEGFIGKATRLIGEEYLTLGYRTLW